MGLKLSAQPLTLRKRMLLNCGDSSSTVKVYNESMRRLWAREKEFDFICLGHDALDKADM